MKTSDLKGAQLDYWVARAEDLSNPRVEDGLCWVAHVDRDNKHGKSVEIGAVFSPSADWAQAGPIIEREDYCLPRVNTNAGALHHGGYAASTPAGFCFYGNTPLIAAMRAYVADKFGDEVPDEI